MRCVTKWLSLSWSQVTRRSREGVGCKLEAMAVSQLSEGGGRSVRWRVALAGALASAASATTTTTKMTRRRPPPPPPPPPQRRCRNVRCFVRCHQLVARRCVAGVGRGGCVCVCPCCIRQRVSVVCCVVGCMTSKDVIAKDTRIRPCQETRTERVRARVSGGCSDSLG